jgi:glycosyltransferase involved in cell wall biosynthesis
MMRTTSLVVVPPLSAYGGVPSMTLYWQNLREAFAALPGDAPRLRPVSPPRLWLGRGWRRRLAQRVVLPALLRRAVREEAAAGRRPAIHILDPHYSHLLPRRGGLVTCHDLDALIAPLAGMAKWEERQRLGAMVRAGAVHAISGNTANDVARYFPALRSRVVVNYYGLAPEFRIRPPAADAPHLAPLRAASGAIFVLHVGSNIERKNIPVLLRGFALAQQRLPGRPLRLVKVGDDLRTDGFAALLGELGLGSEVIQLGSLGVSALVDVYNHCDLFAFPSRYEGFGRPVAEAQACGLPCVLANASSLPEVGGPSARYHRVDDPAGLAAHLIELAGKPGLREQLRAEGVANAGRFTWRRHAQLLVDSVASLQSLHPAAGGRV